MVAGLGLWVGVMVAATYPVAPVGGGNALTLPAQRHVVRVQGQYVLALQQGGQQGRALGMFKSLDGKRWSYLGALPTGARADRADLVAVGSDIALVYSVETPDSSGIHGSPGHDVYFQWWRYSSSRGTWSGSSPLRVFDSPSSSTAYYRAELARDSKGRLWVQAFRKERDGRSSVAISVSSDNGNSFREQPPLDSGLPQRGGGRLLSLGRRLVMVYDTHGTGYTTRYRVRDDSAPLGSWQPARTAFGESIYHGAALSAVADGRGGMHLVYKDDAERLRYRHFDGSRFGPPLMVEGEGDWALQPAITRQGSELVIFYNRPRGGGRYDLVVKRLRGTSLTGATTLDSSSTFKGYPSAVDVLPAGMSVPVLFGNAADASRSGTVSVAFSPSASSLSRSRGEAQLSALEVEGETVAAPVVEATGGSGQGPLAAGPTGSEARPDQMGCGGAEGMSAVAALTLLLLALLGMRRLRHEAMCELIPARGRSE